MTDRFDFIISYNLARDLRYCAEFGGEIITFTESLDTAIQDIEDFVSQAQEVLERAKKEWI